MAFRAQGLDLFRDLDHKSLARDIKLRERLFDRTRSGVVLDADHHAIPGLIQIDRSHSR